MKTKLEPPLFTTKDGEDVTFEDLLAKIYDNSVTKQKHMVDTVNHVKPMIQTLQDAIAMMPILTNLQKVSVENDDALIKIAAIISRSKNKGKINSTNDDFGLTEEDRKLLLEKAKEMTPGASKSDL